MPPRGCPKALLELTSSESEQLERWVRRQKSSQALALRSQIVLACVSELDNTQVAAQERVALPTVGKWRARFIEFRLDGLTFGLTDHPRPGKPATITAEQVENVIVVTLEATPKHATH